MLVEFEILFKLGAFFFKLAANGVNVLVEFNILIGGIFLNCGQWGQMC